jgi:ABC-type transporter Mla MlaB component
VLQILTCDAPSLVSALRSGYFLRAGLRIVTALDAQELLERAAVLRPNVIILVAGLLPPRCERGLAQKLRPHLAAGPSLILLALPRDHMDIGDDLHSYDGVLSLEEPGLDVARALAPLISLPNRRQARMRVRIPATLFAAAEKPIEGVTVDLSGAGAGLHLPSEPGQDPYHVAFSRPDGRRVTLAARAAWIDGFSPRAVRLGVRFLSATLDTVQALYDLAFWELITESGQLVIHLHGEISETTALWPILTRIMEAPRLDLEDVSRVNSAGVLRWMDFLRKIPSDVELRLRRISIPLVRQMLLVPAMSRRCVIESFLAPYECEDCDLDVTELITPGRDLFVPECPSCGESMRLAEPVLGLAGTTAGTSRILRH